MDSDEETMPHFIREVVAARSSQKAALVEVLKQLPAAVGTKQVPSQQLYPQASETHEEDDKTSITPTSTQMPGARSVSVITTTGCHWQAAAYKYKYRRKSSWFA